MRRLLCFGLLLVCGLPLAGAQPVRVVVYDNPPLAELRGGQARGLFVDLLEEIARRRGWTLEYRGASFKEGLALVERGEADLMPVVASSPERRRRYGFNRENVIANWAQVMIRHDTELATVVDLAGRRIAALKGDIYLDGPAGLRQVIDSFGVTTEIIEAESYDEVAALTRDGKVDAGLLNRLSGRALAGRYDLEPTPVIFSPIGLYFALPKRGDRTERLVAAIDEELRQMKAQPGSPYDEAVDRWLQGGRTGSVNQALVVGVIALSVLLAALIGVLLAFRRLQAKLRRTTRAAQAANEAKSEFLANMSHELRTPLNAIIGYADLLHEEARTAQERSDLERIRAAGRHLQSLIDDILDLAKIEAGRMTVNAVEVGVAALVGDVVATSEKLVAENGNTLQVHVPDDLGRAWLDPLRVRQCLLNLLGNAAKFTREGTVTLRVRRRGPLLEFDVSDTGIGVPEEQQERIFGAFDQVADSGGEYGGTGLGLAITRELCQLMGGDIALASVSGEGSTFTMRIQAPPAD